MQIDGLPGGVIVFGIGDLPEMAGLFTRLPAFEGVHEDVALKVGLAGAAKAIAEFEVIGRDGTRRA